MTEARTGNPWQSPEWNPDLLTVISALSLSTAESCMGLCIFHVAVIKAFRHLKYQLLIRHVRNDDSHVHAAQCRILNARAQIVINNKVGRGHIHIARRAVQHILDHALANAMLVDRPRPALRIYLMVL